MHRNVNTIHNLLHASALLECHHQGANFCIIHGMHSINRHNVRMRYAKKLDLTIAKNKSSVQIRRMCKNSSTIDIMDHHYQHHHLAFGLFRLHNAHFFLGRPISLGLYSKAIYGIRDPF